ncbi:MAG: hypothetical protein OEW67_06855 [Cyclobacteriaceae bacterium]|nr:hypothetical protein [Cyclobacteriaceae bacterium]
MNIRLISHFLLLSIILLQFVSCSKKINKSNSTAEVIVYPAPPDTARIQYLTTINNSLQITGEKSKFAKFVVGEDAPLPIKKPYGVYMKNGKIYVCDLDIGGLEIIDLETKTFDYFVPKGLGQLKMPINCFVDDKDFIYIADAYRKQIVIFDNNRNYVDSFGDTEGYKPTDVVVFDDKIWVANIKGNSILVYKNDATHQLLYSIPRAKEGEEGFIYQPTNISVTDDKVYVSDFGDFTIKIYTHEGEYIGVVGSYGKSMGQFARPKGIAVDRESNLYVVDAAFENVQIFNNEGKLMTFFGGPYKGPGDMWLPAKVTIDYDNLEYFQQYVDKRFSLKYLVFVTNNFGPDKINVYGYIEAKE